VAAFLALAAIGATLGWTLTDTNGVPTSYTATGPSPSVSAPHTTSRSGPATPKQTQKPPTGLTIPNFAASGTSFQNARLQLMAKKVQAVLEFQGGNGGDKVVGTIPAAGTPMKHGDSVKLLINEDPPLLAVPDETHKACNSAGSDLARVGFRPQYATGRNGTVQSQNPPAGSGTAHWNDYVTLTCGTNTNPSPSAGTSAPATNPSPAPSN